ncbi:ABC transporter ATP-binding protein [Treponema sp. OMZ 799]|uniref:ATP-binding cassette domain-containing protein n=1 Tax=Treponema sp. OMZ 799 TaxID=2563668 RepID=UPI0020A51070|nr:ABC transporter ATP-binding protein [Treponema sp. OMZ 799]UTC76694.1 ABC transporter ATP-binding protein [Treponema sp. OMZ 799]
MKKNAFASKYFFKNKLSFFLVIILAAAAYLFNVGTAFLLKLIADSVLNYELNKMIFLAVCTAVYIFAAVLSDFLAHYSRVKFCKNISYLLKNDIILSLLNKSVLHKEKKSYSDYQSLLLNDVLSLEQNYFDALLSCLYQVLNLVFSFLSVLYIQPIFLPVILLICVFPVLFPKLTQNKLEGLQKNKSDARSFFIKKLSDVLNGFRTIKMYGAEEAGTKYSGNANYDYTQAEIKLAKRENLIMSSAFGAGLLIILLTWVSGAFFIRAGLLTFSGLIALTKIAESIAGPFQIIGERYAGIMSSKAIEKTINSVLQEKEELHRLKDFKEVQIKDCVIVKEDKECLNVENLALRIGDRILVTGLSGSGKSTLLNVLAGFEKNTGKLYIDGVLQETDINLSSYVFMLEQKTHIFDAGLIENITLFDKSKNTAAEDAIKKLNIAYLSTKLENQKKFSGGEERRIDFARLLIRNLSEKIVLLDEPFSGLDAENTENMIKIINGLNPKILIVTTHEAEKLGGLNYNRLLKIENTEIKPLKFLANKI